MARRKRGLLGVPGLSFSWKRALGVSSYKAKLSRKIGIPLTKSGRQRKVGSMLGCFGTILLFLNSAASLFVFAIFAAAAIAGSVSLIKIFLLFM